MGAKNALTRGQSTRLQPWMRESPLSTLSMGMGPQGAGNIFLLRLRRWMHLVTPNRNAHHWPPVKKMRFSVNRDESSREFEMSPFLELVLLRVFELYILFSSLKL